MKKLSQAFDFQKFQQNPKLAGIVRETEGRYAKAALSDDDHRIAADTFSPLQTLPARSPKLV